MHKQRLRGQIDALSGLEPWYGCHYGMRSTLERDKAEYSAGWTEVEFYLRNGDCNGTPREDKA